MCPIRYFSIKEQFSEKKSSKSNRRANLEQAEAKALS